MKQIIFTDSFLKDMLQITNPRLEGAIFDTIGLLPYAPALGSRALPNSVRHAFGEEARKISVPPFDIIYTVVNKDDFLILGLVHQRAAR